MPKIKLPLITLLFFITGFFDPCGETLATLIAATLHEIGHVSVMLYRGIGLKDLTVTPYGLEINKKRDFRSFPEEISVSLSGCAVNLVTFFILFRHGGFPGIRRKKGSYRKVPPRFPFRAERQAGDRRFRSQASRR